MAADEVAGLDTYEDQLRLFAYLVSGSLLEAEMMTGQVLDSAASESDKMLLFKRISKTCIERLADRPPRTLPSLALPLYDPAAPPDPGSDARAWLEPFPDDLFPDELKGPDPARAYSARECISLYLAAALQEIPPQRRAALILSDLFGWSADCTEAVLDLDEPGLRALLDQARETMTRSYSQDLGRRVPPPEADATALFMMYLYPWETSDVDGLAARLAEDVVFQNPPSPAWYCGIADFTRFAREQLIPEGSRGRWRLLPTRASGQLGFGAYRLNERRRLYEAHSIQVVFFDADLVTEIICIDGADLFPLFGLLPEVVVQGFI
jgi:RNA polymerase sigma-70 factor (ECF subfamily)